MSALSYRAESLHSVAVTGMGMSSCVGASTAQTLTSLRAGVARMVEYPAYEPIVRDAAAHLPESLIAAPAVDLPSDTGLSARLLALAVPALVEALDVAGLSSAPLRRACLYIVGGQTPQTRAGSRPAATLGPRLAQRVGVHFEQIGYFDTGAAGYVTALGASAASLMAGACDVAVVGAVDSLLGLDTLQWLDEGLRLKTPEHPSGLVPGEGAAFVVLEPASGAAGRGASLYARVGGVAASNETDTISSDTPCTGGALAACVEDVLRQAAVRGAPPTTTYCTLDGEGYFATEWGYALNRLTGRGWELPQTTLHPADCVGNTGAAMGGMLTCLAADSVRAASTGPHHPLIWCSADGGERAAAYLLPA